MIRDAIAAGTSQFGMQTFDQSLFDLYTKNLITLDEALLRASNADEFKLRIQGVRSASDSARALPETFAPQEPVETTRRETPWSDLPDDTFASEDADDAEEAAEESAPTPAEALEGEDAHAPDDALGLYLRQMGAIPLLSRDQELALAERLEFRRRRFRHAAMMNWRAFLAYGAVTAVITPTFIELTIDVMVSGLSNIFEKCCQPYCFISKMLGMSRMNRNFRNAAISNAMDGSTTTTSK